MMIETIANEPERETRRPCVCGATIYPVHREAQTAESAVWLCARFCGARGYSYEGALRRKVRLDLLSWGDSRRSNQALSRYRQTAARARILAPL